MRIRVPFEQIAQELGIAGAPVRGLLAGVICGHEIVRVRIILAERHNDHLRVVVAEIPVGGLAERGIVLHTIPDALHAEVIGRVEPADAVKQRCAAL